jgi:hypothetical protein
MAVKSRRDATHAAAPAAATDNRGGGSYGATTSQPNNNKKQKSSLLKPLTKSQSRSVFTTHPGAPRRVRVYVLTYFFSSLTIDKWRLLRGCIPIGWIFSSLAEWLGVPICHTNVQVSEWALRVLRTHFS